MDPEMSTPNRGSILPQADSPIDSIGVGGRSAYREPAEFTPGPNCEVGIGSRNARSYPFPADEYRDGLWSNDSGPTDHHFGKAGEGEER
jgi:hypothetical protein